MVACVGMLHLTFLHLFLAAWQLNFTRVIFLAVIKMHPNKI